MAADRTELEAALPAWLPGERWFGDKARPIAGCRVIASYSLDGDADLHIVRVEFADGSPADYVVPTVDGSFSAATTSAAFLTDLGHVVSGSREWGSSISRRELSRDPADLGLLPATALDVEQSNTTIRYGDQWAVKLSRRLSYGPSPELDLSAVMNRWTGDRCAPRVAVALDIRTDAGAAPLAIQAEFIVNLGDGWAFVLDALRAEASSAPPSFHGCASIREVEAVADLTADMHAALSLDPWTANVAPERITEQVVRGWQAAVGESLQSGLDLLDAARPTLGGQSGRLADLVSATTPTLHTHLENFRSLVGSQRIRVHGDYHLGQVLRTKQGRYVAIDFDGEPQRSLDERRAKYSPLRDVAGMLGSFAYAVGTVQSELDDVLADGWLRAWERAARTAYVSRYVGRSATNGRDLVPPDPERIRQALAALEFEKAVYMIHYELNNRPDWVWIPLSQLVKMG